MSSTQDLYNAFESFCSFGSSRNLATGSSDNINGPSMDNQRFSKFCKDTKIIDNKKVTSTDCDILFNQIKAKGARRIGFSEFQNGFQALANKKFPGKNPADAYDSLLHLCCDKGPKANGVTVADASGVYDKLTDTTKYTGTHKNRFDENGVGKGGDGRQVIDSNTHDLNQLVNRETNFKVPNNTFSGSVGVGAPKKRGTIVTASTESLEIKAQPNLKKQDNRTSQNSLQRQTGTPATGPTRSSQGSLNNVNKSQSGLNKSTNSINKVGSGSVFDRLTDVKGYTGSHKERFNADGSGKGIAGRGTIAKGSGTQSTYHGGDVKDLSQILRN